jgi:hypothetical protein
MTVEVSVLSDRVDLLANDFLKFRQIQVVAQKALYSALSLTSTIFFAALAVIFAFATGSPLAATLFALTSLVSGLFYRLVNESRNKVTPAK